MKKRKKKKRGSHVWVVCCYSSRRGTPSSSLQDGAPLPPGQRKACNTHLTLYLARCCLSWSPRQCAKHNIYLSFFPADVSGVWSPLICFSACVGQARRRRPRAGWRWPLSQTACPSSESRTSGRSSSPSSAATPPPCGTAVRSKSATTFRWGEKKKTF